MNWRFWWFRNAVQLALQDAKYGVTSTANGHKEFHIMIIVMWMRMVSVYLKMHTKRISDDMDIVIGNNKSSWQFKNVMP